VCVFGVCVWCVCVCVFGVCVCVWCVCLCIFVTVMVCLFAFAAKCLGHIAQPGRVCSLLLKKPLLLCIAWRCRSPIHQHRHSPDTRPPGSPQDWHCSTCPCCCRSSPHRRHLGDAADEGRERVWRLRGLSQAAPTPRIRIPKVRWRVSCPAL
jgi:hypothetical protein